MKQCLLRVNLRKPPTEAVISDVMAHLMEKRADVKGYQWEPAGDHAAHILLWYEDDE